MSEQTKNKRERYRKNRDKWIFSMATIAVILTLSILGCSILAVNLSKTETVNFNEGGNIDYNVFLKENEFYEEKMLGKDKIYVASLIDNIVANFSYRANTATDDVTYRYSYRVTSNLEIAEKGTSGKIYDTGDAILEKKGLVAKGSSLAINEIVVIGYDEYNELAKSFLRTYDLEGMTSNIVLRLEVELESDAPALARDYESLYTSELRIPLTQKTVEIAMVTEVPDGGNAELACAAAMGGDAFRVTAIVLAVLDAILIPLMIAFIYLTRTVDMAYTARVRRVLSQYKSYIQRIRHDFDATGYRVVNVDRFDELLEIRETLSAPILMFENEEKTCTRFQIPTDAKLLYVYEIAVEGYSEKKKPVVEKATAKEAPAPEVVEVFAKTLETKEAPTTESVIAEEIPTPEEEAFMQDAAECVWVTEENASVLHSTDAIDVILGETQATFDPDGNELESGDVVLVPTSDEFEGEIAVEAEVSRGNYQTEVENPLRKIIGVVRRRAERAFTSLIEDEEDK